MMFYCVFLLPLLFFSMGCSYFKGHNEGSPGKTVFGPGDGRIPIVGKELFDYPSRTVAQIRTIGRDQCDEKGVCKKVNGICTGTLVYRNLVLTNAHCVLNTNTFRPEYAIELGFISTNGVDWGTARGISAIWGLCNSQQFMKDCPQTDWAIITISPFVDNGTSDMQIAGYFPGDILGWMYTQPLNISPGDVPRPIGPFGIAGYNIDIQKAAVITKSACNIRGKNPDGSLKHDCPIKPGASGTALTFAFPGQSYSYISALNNGQRLGADNQQLPDHIAYDGSIANLAVPAQSFYTALQNAIAQQEALLAQLPK